MDRHLGHYRIVEHLGSGSMGEVYLAEDENLGRRVALKLLPRQLADDPQRLRRFRREARALAKLNHPNIVTVHSVEQADGLHFLTMENVEGSTLAEVIPEGGLEPRDFFDLAIPLAEALAAAHGRGIVHRDLKPGNVMVATDRTVKVVDFGLAKAAPQPGPEDVTQVAEETLTQAGGIVGTMPYMSPEQLEGKPLDGRSDVFSLGVVLYEMATGQRPRADESPAAPIAALMSDELAQVDELRGELPHQLARIIRHCLKKDPEHRFQTARDVANELLDLKDELTTRSEHIRPVAPRSPARSYFRWIPAMVAGALLLALGGWILWRALPSRGPTPTTEEQLPARPEIERIVVLPFDNLGAPADEFFATGISDEITSRLAAVAGLGVISRSSAQQYQGSGKPVQQIAEELDVSYVLEGRVRWSPDGKVRVTPALVRASDGINLWGDIYDRVIDDIFEVQSEIAFKVVHRLGVALLDSERQALASRPTGNLAAYQAFLRGSHHARQPHFSVENWKKVLASYQEAVELDPDYALAWAALSRAHAQYYYRLADRSEKRRMLARDALARAAELEPNAPEVHLARGYYFIWLEHDPDRALDELELAEARMPNNAELLKAKGELLRSRGEWTASLRAYQQARETSPRDPSIQYELAEGYWQTRQYERALEACEQTLTLGPDPAWQTWGHLIKAYNYWCWKGALPEARAALEFVPVDHEFAPWSWFWQEVYEGDYARALNRLETLPDGWIRVKIAARPAPLLAALVHDLLGENERSREAYESARLLLEAEIETSPEDPRLHSSLGIAYAALGRRDNAVRHGETAVELLPLSQDAFYGIPYVLDLAFIHALLGEDDAAIDQIELLLRRPSWLSSPFLEMDPRFDRLRQNPRFVALLEEHHRREEPRGRTRGAVR